MEQAILSIEQSYEWQISEIFSGLQSFFKSFLLKFSISCGYLMYESILSSLRFCRYFINTVLLPSACILASV